MNTLREKCDELLGLYEELKREIRQKDKHLYERWKAGGYLVDDNIVSYYPHLGQVVDQLSEEDEPEDE